MSSVADIADAVIGGDTHADTHSLEIVAPTGVVLARIQVSNDPPGYARAVSFITEFAPGPRVFAGIEGTRSYGLGLSRALTAAGVIVIEVEQPSRKARRGKGKSDEIDAHLAALATLALDPQRLAVPRADGEREGLRILLVGRREMTNTRTRQVNALRALLRTGDDTDQASASGAFTTSRLQTLARRRAHINETRDQAIRRGEIHRLAHAIQALDEALKANMRLLDTVIKDIAPSLLELCGVGPVSAAQLIVSFSHTGRCRNEAAFAALAGVSPIPASSGKTDRHRINHGGDRALNRALHDIAKTRMRHDERTRAYVTRRRTETRQIGDKAIRRCLKRYIARELFHHLEAVFS